MLKRKEEREFSSEFSIENLLKKPKGCIKSISNFDGNCYPNVFFHKKKLETSIKCSETSGKIKDNKLSEKINGSVNEFSREQKISHHKPFGSSPKALAGLLVESEFKENTSLKILFSERPIETKMELYEEFYKRTTYPPLNILQNQSDCVRSAFSVPLWNDHLSLKSSSLRYPCSHRKQDFLYPNNDDSKKCVQVRFSHSQSTELERVFLVQKYISPYERKQISRSLDLSERQIKTWFQNRRAKWRRLKAEDELKIRVATKINSY
ncbi:homeobox protein ceh-28 [Hydra vulgaris]|uniref:Hematopoietically-expressed homeobox protein HHEX n=1 Tax=Hydra vulgaris TaxID=6087 RepID=T2MEI9_HYDVU|nr:homeobox protein ceh-28 [Hydra vulgaris]